MPPLPDPPPPPQKEFEDPGTILSPVENVRDIRKFFKTRRAILAGEKLYSLSKSELSALDLMGPWKFNVTQSLICSVPGAILAGVMWLFPLPPVPVSGPAIDPVQDQILSVLTPFVPPFTLLLIVFSVAYCSVPVGLVTMLNWKAAQRKYLYLDASYGFYPQFLISFCIAVVRLGQYGHAGLLIVGGAAAICLFVTIIWQGFVTGFKIRMGLFEYDYIPKPEMFATLDEPPLFKFYVLLVIALYGIAILLSMGLHAITLWLSIAVHHLRGN